MSKLPWKPWHQVVALRDDLKTGELSLQMFAADLYEVIMKRGKQPVYEKPENFFSLTFPTHNLRNLVRDVALRLANKNDKAVRQLELTYGGGKTHTEITLYHLHSDPDHLPDVPAVHEFREAIGQKPVKACVAGLCFDKLDVETGMDVRGPNRVRAEVVPSLECACLPTGWRCRLEDHACQGKSRGTGHSSCRKHANRVAGTAREGRPRCLDPHGRSYDVREGEGDPEPGLARCVIELLSGARPRQPPRLRVAVS